MTDMFNPRLNDDLLGATFVTPLAVGLQFPSGTKFARQVETASTADWDFDRDFDPDVPVSEDTDTGEAFLSKHSGATRHVGNGDTVLGPTELDELVNRLDPWHDGPDDDPYAPGRH